MNQLLINTWQDSDGEWWASPQERNNNGTYKYPTIGRGDTKKEAVSNCMLTKKEEAKKYSTVFSEYITTHLSDVEEERNAFIELSNFVGWFKNK